MGKILNDFLVLTGLIDVDEISSVDVARHERLVEYFKEKELGYDVSCSELKDIDRVYIASC
jgi:hypothetical protein